MARAIIKVYAAHVTVSPRTIFHSFKGTIGCLLFPRRWRGNRRGNMVLSPKGFQGMEGIIVHRHKLQDGVGK